MTEISGAGGLPKGIVQLPISAIQALYHAVTGKTENLSQNFRGDFVVRKSDLDQLHTKIHQQLEQYETLAPPTVSVKVVLENQEHQQFSSWERFSAMDSSRAEVVSEVTVKYEFLLRLPNIENPQRYVLNINVDSRLPVVSSGQEDSPVPWFIIYSVPTLDVSIDFVDYLCAKNFMQVVEGWFNSLERVKRNKWVEKLALSRTNWGFAFSRISSLNVAVFLFLFAYLNDSRNYSAQSVVYLIATAVLIWMISTVVTWRLGRIFTGAVRRSIVPASILLTKGDERKFAEISQVYSRALPGIIKAMFGAIGAVSLNIIASFLYTWLSK